jgi:hypothetical protein
MTARPAPCQPGLKQGGAEGILVHMTAKDKEREERLAAALRENLRRRKAQSREIAAEEKKDEPER